MPLPQNNPTPPSPGGGTNWGAYIPAAIGAGASIAGGYMANQASAQEAKKNRQFQERMRSTQWQTAVADMEAAGLNPALAYSQGSAGTPGGSSATQQDILTPAVGSAMQAKTVQAQLKLVRRQIEETAARAAKTQTENWGLQQANKLWGTTTADGKFHPGPLNIKAQSEASSAAAVARLQQLQIPNAKNLANIAGSSPGQTLAWIKYIMQSMPKIGGK